MSSKILYISYDGMTDPLGQSQVIPYLKELSKVGHSFHLISFEKKDSFAKNKKIIEPILKDTNITWHPLKYTSKPPVISTLLDVFKMKNYAQKLHQKHHFDIIHCRSYIAALAGLRLKKKYGVQFLFDMRGFWANERIDGGIWDLKNPIFRLIYHYFKKKEMLFLSKADHVVSLTEKAKIEIKTWHNLAQTPISVIPCCSDLTHFSTTSINAELLEQKRKEVEIDSHCFVLSYLGSLGTWYLPEEMMLFYKSLKAKYNGAKFLFITPDSSDLIYSLAAKNGIDKADLIIKKASREEVPIYLMLSTISIFFIKPAYSKIASSPTKMGEILGMGIPIITNSGIGDVDRIIQNTSCGLLIKEFSSDAYDQAIDKIDELIKTPKQVLTFAAVKHFSLENGAKKYNEIYNQLLS